jgi:protoporphyrinogen IX oxidase
MQHYHQIFAVHLVAIVVFGGSVVVNAFMLPSLARGEAAQRAPELLRVWRWALFVATPALCLVWACGATMAVLVGWFAASWLQLKLVFVLFLTALHVHQLHALWQMRRGRRPSAVPTWLVAPTIAALGVIVLLASAKPMLW